MTIQAIVVFVLLAALIVPVVRAEIARRPVRRPLVKDDRSVKRDRPVKRETVAKTPLRLVVNKSDMDRELAALLAKNRDKSPERED